MTYISTGYKYGVKTKKQIDSIPTSGLEVGDNVYNSDINKEEYWTGNTWLNDDCVEMINNNGSTIHLGQLVCVKDGGAAAYYSKLVSNTEDNFFQGVVYRGGANGDWVVIACTGLYPTTFASSVTSLTRQHIAIISATVGYAGSSGSKLGGAGSIGTISQSLPSLSITAFADAGGGQVTVTSAGHGLLEDSYIEIAGTTNYNGHYFISNITANTFEITDTWVSDDATGTITVKTVNCWLASESY